MDDWLSFESMKKTPPYYIWPYQIRLMWIAAYCSNRKGLISVMNINQVYMSSYKNSAVTGNAMPTFIWIQKKTNYEELGSWNRDILSILPSVYISVLQLCIPYLYQVIWHVYWSVLATSKWKWKYLPFKSNERKKEYNSHKIV